MSRRKRSKQRCTLWHPSVAAEAKTYQAVEHSMNRSPSAIVKKYTSTTPQELMKLHSFSLVAFLTESQPKPLCPPDPQNALHCDDLPRPVWRNLHNSVEQKLCGNGHIMFASSFQRIGRSFCIGTTHRYATRQMSTRTLSHVSVEALYKYRSNDVSKCTKQAMGDW